MRSPEVPGCPESSAHWHPNLPSPPLLGASWSHLSDNSNPHLRSFPETPKHGSLSPQSVGGGNPAVDPTGHRALGQLSPGYSREVLWGSHYTLTRIHSTSGFLSATWFPPTPAGSGAGERDCALVVSRAVDREKNTDLCENQPGTFNKKISKLSRT